MERQMHLVLPPTDSKPGERINLNVGDNLVGPILIPLVWLPLGTKFKLSDHEYSTDLEKYFDGGPLRRLTPSVSDSEYNKTTLGSSHIPVVVRTAHISGSDFLLLKSIKLYGKKSFDRRTIGVRLEQLENHLAQLKASGKDADGIPVLVQQQNSYRRGQLVISTFVPPKDTVDKTKGLII